MKALIIKNKGGISLEDDKIVQLFLSRDEEAIRKTSEKYGTRLRAVALAITSDYQTSEECENDTYVQAWNLIPPNEPKTYLYAFLARIIRHISIDRCRKEKTLKRGAFITELTEEMEMCISDVKDLESELEAKELGAAISKFLRSLPKEKRVIFVRRYFFMDSVAEISKRCAISESKVKTVLFRVRKELREYLKKEGYLI